MDDRTLALLGDRVAQERMTERGELVEADRNGRCVVLPYGGYTDKDGENALTLTRTLGDRKVTVCVMPAPSVWPVAMIVKVKAEKGLVIWVQNFESAESAMEAIRKWELT